MTTFAPRYFILPLIALVVIGSLPAPAGGSAPLNAACGPTVGGATAPAVRGTFEQFQQRQSAAAHRICALHRNAMASAAR